MSLFSINNSTFNTYIYGSTIESILTRKKVKYELVFYDNLYARFFEPLLLNIKKHLPPDHIELYANGIASQTSVFNDRWVGLVII